MKFLNVLFACLLVAAFTSCDTTKNLTSSTPSTTSTSTAANTSVNSRSAPTSPTRNTDVATPSTPELSAPSKPEMSVPSKPTMDKSTEMSDVKKPAKTGVKKPMKDGVKKPAKTAGKDISSGMSKPMGKIPGKITWAAANDRYSADGSFKNWQITKVKMNGDDLNTLTARIEIDLTSIHEKSPKLTNHLKADDYFGVSQYTTATIDVTKVISAGKTNMATMVLKMRGKQQTMKSNFEVVSTSPLRIKGSAMVDRSIFGIGVENTSVPSEIKVMYDTTIPR